MCASAFAGRRATASARTATSAIASTCAATGLLARATGAPAAIAATASSRLLDRSRRSPFHYLKAAQIQPFVRNCHPRVCEQYNSSAGCSNRSHCPRLHLCNWFLLGECECRDASRCSGTRSHDLHSAQCRAVYARFNLTDLANNPNFRSLHWLLTPLAGAAADGARPTNLPIAESKADEMFGYTFDKLAGANWERTECDAAESRTFISSVMEAAWTTILTRTGLPPSIRRRASAISPICLEIPQRVCLAIPAASARLLADADDADARRPSADTEFELCACAGASK